ncbi:NYN domain-containing protein [Bradyrhizobium sp. CB1717]|uniref:NYN domain-containing protein n=1 Tax=Bradyrhizobium sp. CB1717 TaxID=3039154 RepID=UPI0024B04FC4|nr:NYN domain-containing protein [Bradyrhizobium sp. CB1717]WFU26299.1 NYN domain-containing protein [Bradyrhizobium sp. CB1717]
MTLSSPSVTAGGVSISEPPPKARAALYVDGFNLYHAIDALKQPHLKWLNLFSLGSRILNRNKEQLVKVRYCTALKPGDSEKNKRHREYITALKWFNVKVQEGHFIEDEIDCRRCGHTWDAPKEKETDVNVALLLFDDAYQDVFDVAYLLTADSDQGATARMLKRRFPEKRLISVVPPGMDASKAIMTYADGRYTLNADLIEECLLPGMEIDTSRGGQVAFQRPKEYEPPAGWVAPALRPKKAKKQVS